MTQVLVAEDNKSILFLLVTLLRQIKVESVAVEDGEQALEYLTRENVFAVVVTDINLPKLDGLQLLEIIKRDYPHQKVMVVSAYVERLAEAAAKGADHVLRKPFTYQQFIEVIQEAIH
jgi:CheY-like chemotaxis protein